MRKPVVLLIAVTVCLLPHAAIAQDAAATWYCPVSQKLDAERRYGAESLVTGQFSVRIVETAPNVTLQRCSFVRSAGEVTCDSYVVDHVERDEHIGARKYYVFRGQFDVQLFADGSFVENNGRGGIAFGRCSLMP